MIKDRGKCLVYNTRTQTTDKWLVILEMNNTFHYRRNKLNPRQIDAETRMRRLDVGEPAVRSEGRGHIGFPTGKFKEHLGKRRDNDAV